MLHCPPHCHATSQSLEFSCLQPIRCFQTVRNPFPRLCTQKIKKKYIYFLFYSPSDKKFHSHRVVHVTGSWHVSIPNVNFSQFHPLPIASFRAEQPWCPKRATLPPNSESVSLSLSPSLWLITIPMIFLETPNPFISFYFWSRFWPQLLEFRGSPSFQIFEILFNRRALLIS